MENKIVVATKMLARSDVEDKPRILQVIYESFGKECEIFFIQALEDENYKVRISAMDILLELHKEDAIQFIEPLVEDQNFWVRRHAKKLITKISNN